MNVLFLWIHNVLQRQLFLFRKQTLYHLDFAINTIDLSLFFFKN